MATPHSHHAKKRVFLHYFSGILHFYLCVYYIYIYTYIHTYINVVSI